MMDLDLFSVFRESSMSEVLHGYIKRFFYFYFFFGWGGAYLETLPAVAGWWAAKFVF